MSSNPETIHQIMILFSDRGTPDGFHQQDGFGGTTFKWCKADDTFYYVKVHVKVTGGTQVCTPFSRLEPQNFFDFIDPHRCPGDRAGRNRP